MADNNSVDLKKEKNKVNAKNILKKLRIPIAILLVVIIAVSSYLLAGPVRRSNFADRFKAIPKTIGETSGYPYSEDELSLDRLMLIGDKPLIVTDDGIEVLSNGASLLQQLHLEWADTRAVSFNGRAFVYSNTSGKAYLISRTGVLETFNEESPIITGTVGKNGCVALSYSTESIQSVVKVYDTRQKLDFEWHCSKEFVSSMALSKSGDRLAVVAVGVDNAELYSRIILFKTDKTEPVFDIKTEGTTFLKVFVSPGGKIVAVGDNKSVILNSKGETLSEISYADDALCFLDNDVSGNVLICYKEFGGAKIKAAVIPSSGKEIKEIELGYMPQSADIRGSKIAFSNGNTVEVLTTSGVQKNVYECKSDVSTVLIGSSGIITLENGSVCKYH